MDRLSARAAVPVLGDGVGRGHPWNLSRWSRPVGWIAVVWVACVAVLFCLSQSSPVAVDSMDYDAIALAVVLVLASVWWYLTRRSYGTPTTAAYGSDRDQAELAEGIV